MQIDRIKRGVARYIDNEIIGRMTDTTSRWVTGGIAALAVNNLGETVKQYEKDPFIAMLGVMKEGDVDIDAVYQAFAPRMVEKVSFVLPIVGKLTFDRNDLDKLMECIREA